MKNISLGSQYLAEFYGCCVEAINNQDTIRMESAAWLSLQSLILQFIRGTVNAIRGSWIDLHFDSHPLVAEVLVSLKPVFSRRSTLIRPVEHQLK